MRLDYRMPNYRTAKILTRNWQMPAISAGAIVWSIDPCSREYALNPNSYSEEMRQAVAIALLKKHDCRNERPLIGS